MTGPRLFALVRIADPTGVSGTGTVATGVQWPDGTVALHWSVRDLPSSTAVWESIEAVEAVHGHDGLTTVVWDGELAQEVRSMFDLPEVRNLLQQQVDDAPAEMRPLVRRAHEVVRALLEALP